MLGAWCEQRRTVEAGLVVFVAGAGGIFLWQPELIADFPRSQFLDAYVVAGLLGIGLVAAGCGRRTDALALGLYALGYGVLVAPLLSPELATTGTIALLSLTVLLAEARRTTEL